jgi:nucleotide-binding universal stress UspA family protein
LFESGRPLLVVPTECAAPSRFHRALVAWKSSREATRALHDALSLGLLDQLTALECAVVNSSASGGPKPPVTDALVDHLSRHRIHSKIVNLSRDGQSVAARLLHHASHSHAQLLIAGGYGHPRLSRWILGGTTGGLLASTPIPILFSH